MLSLMVPLSNRILLARKTAGLLQQDLAEASNLSQGKISRIESGKTRPNSEDLLNIAMACGTTVASLCGEAVREDGASYNEKSPCASIPVTGGIDARRTGDAHINETDSICSVILFSETERGLLVKGDSMRPVIEDGQIVIYDTKKSPQDGDLCVAKIPRGKNKGMYFRRYQELDRRSALLVAINRDGKSMHVRKNEVELFLVTGAKYTRQNRK